MEIDFAQVADNYALLEEEEKTMIREAMSGPICYLVGLFTTSKDNK